jgi:putative FmdB family regulatory protein
LSKDLPMSMILFDYECKSCAQVFEELVDRDSPEPVKCPSCGQFDTTRLITGTTIDPNLGLDAESFPTMGDKWAKKREQRRRQESRRSYDSNEE